MCIFCSLSVSALCCCSGWDGFFKCTSDTVVVVLLVVVQGDVVHWLACALYSACRKGSVPTVGKGVMEGNCVSLTRILRSSKLRSVLSLRNIKERNISIAVFKFLPLCSVSSLIQFFSKMRKWSDMSNLSQHFRLRMDQLERNFEVSTVIFRKFEPIFMHMFQNPQGGDPPRQPRSRKHRWDTDMATTTQQDDNARNPDVYNTHH